MSIETYRDASRTVDEEVVTRLPVVSGALPPGLRGVLFRNGPGRQERGGLTYGHPFDGDGMLTRFAFTPQGVLYRNRFVETREFLAERAARKPLFRGFGTNLPGGLRANLLRIRFKNAANTSVIRWGGKLLALWEGGLPHAIDPDSLACEGRHDFEGQLRHQGPAVMRWLTPELPFSAHPKVDPERGELYNFGTLFGPRHKLLIHRVDASGQMDTPRALTLDRLAFLHDFTLTRRFLVFFLFPVSFDVARSLLGLLPPAEAIQQRLDAPTRIWLVPRDGGPPRTFEARPGFVFHFAGAFEESERVVVDGFRMERFPRVEGSSVLRGSPVVDYPSPMLTRFTLDLTDGSVQERQLTEHPGELPGLMPRATLGPHRYVWAIGGPPGHPDPFFHGIWKLDTTTGETRSRSWGDDLPGEPVLVPRPGARGEDDGWLLSLVYRAASRRSELVVLDASTLEEEARLALPHHVPPGFHGTWVPEG
ncbi:MAG: carotenoid oxygenase family protein [Polyangiaceae bacterium]|jgi:all-trans-8'-apo-beta-carotenal 15,15'-oxygenase|nr:carotenoid oxygenase family protein [Polyangiaceae bacterium]